MFDKHRHVRYGLLILGVGLGGLVHAVTTWPFQPVIALFGGGALIALSAEIIGVAGGLLDHRLQPQLLGVPVVIIIGWPGMIYLALRLARAVVGPGLAAPVLAASMATTIDAVLEPTAVRDEIWAYPATPLSKYRYAGVPYWNAVAWFGISYVTASLPGVAA